MKDVRIAVVYGYLALLVGGVFHTGLAVSHRHESKPKQSLFALCLVLVGITMSCVGLSGMGRIASQTRTAFWTPAALQSLRNLHGRFAGSDQAGIIDSAMTTYENCVICIDRGAKVVVARWPDGQEWTVLQEPAPANENGQTVST